MNKYQIIYADPPWEYRKSGGIKSARGLAKTFYPTMPIEDIMGLPVADIADKDCYLFLWVTAPSMQEGLDVLKAWGFKFSTVAFTWVKGNTRNQESLFWGMGSTTRANPEYVLLGRKGKLERLDKGVHSVLMSPVQRHSQKPAEIRNRIKRLYGDLPRVELFARDKVDGWDIWGNELKNDLALTDTGMDI